MLPLNVSQTPDAPLLANRQNPQAALDSLKLQSSGVPVYVGGEIIGYRQEVTNLRGMVVHVARGHRNGRGPRISES